MKDLDFDELDRAVNTLMNDVSKTDLTKDDDQTKTISINPTLPPDATPEQAPPIQVAPTPVVDTPRPTPAPAPAARRGGRFMDVVHHSSDMKRDKPASIQPISRQGTTVEPVTPTPAPVEKEPTPYVAPVEKPVFDATPEEPVHAADWPDPLEMSGFTAESPAGDSEPAAKVTPVQPDPMPLLEEGSETAVTAPASDDLQPLTSPFLSGTKVDKRPLGSNATTTPDEAPEPDHTPVVEGADTDLTVDNPNDQLPAQPTEVKKELPPELQGDLVAIESGAATENMKPAEPIESEKPKEQPVARIEAHSADETVATGPSSIVQQYKEEPSTGDQRNGAIYDTDSYHQPLAHPAKKKSGWLWVVWIILILLVGAGAGAALYFLRII